MKFSVTRHLCFTVGLAFALICMSHFAAGQVQLSDSDLYRFGQLGYANGNCVKASRYWFAYLQRAPSGLTQDRRTKMERVIQGCDEMPTRYAFTSVVFAVKRPTLEQRCNTYAEIAVAQYEASQLSNCNLSGPRWSPDPSYHSQWCLSEGPKADMAADIERRARDRALAQCTAAK